MTQIPGDRFSVEKSKPVQYNNVVLSALSSESLKRLELEPFQFAVGQSIESPEAQIRHLYFLETGLASTVVRFLDLSSVGVGTLGNESIIGMSALIGSIRSFNSVVTQIAATGFRCSVKSGRTEFANQSAFRLLVVQSLSAQLITLTRAVGCAATHSLEQRLARFLLLCSDQAGLDSFMMTHFNLAEILGCTRPTATIAAGKLWAAGLIEYRMGTVTILDQTGLEKAACECSSILEAYLHERKANSTE